MIWLMGAGVLAVAVLWGRTGSFTQGLPDCEPEDQKGNFITTYDSYYENASRISSVPFALIKAHAIRESSQKVSAYRDEGKGRASYSLMQLLWWPQSNRFAKWGYPDDNLEAGSALYKPEINTIIAGKLIKENLERFNGNLRDAINAYNTGVAEKVRVAPHNYVDDVLNYYSKIIGRKVT